MLGYIRSLLPPHQDPVLLPHRLLPLLQWATEGGGRGAVQGSRDELSELFNLLPTCCSMLCFMMTDQAPQHGAPAGLGGTSDEAANP